MIQPNYLANSAGSEFFTGDYGRYLAHGIAGEADREGARVWLERARAQGVAEADDDLKALLAVAPA